MAEKVGENVGEKVGESSNLHYHVDSSFDHKETSSVIIILTICIHNLVVAEGS